MRRPTWRRMGCESRALQLVRQVAEANPTRAEPLGLALDLATRLGDVPATQWACLAILNQAWPKHQNMIESRARRVATAVLEQLVKDGKTADADAFRAQLEETKARDCVVVVRWTGEADVDLMVEEPAGTVCSLADERTTSGGVLLGDAFAGSSDRTATAADGFSEVYVCPQAFKGQYRVLVRRVWGDVAAGKVTVGICTGYQTPNSKEQWRQIPLAKKDAMVIFDVPEGRRQEPLADHVVAKVARDHLQIGQSVLAQQQQVASLSDPSVIRDFELARRAGVVDPRLLAAGRGAVGYQPVITQLPEGSTMQVTAVISADRRYVRVSPSPFFSQVTEVSTFNYATGQGGTQGGGAGGIGGGGGLGGGGFGGGGMGGGGMGGGGFGGF